MAFSLSEEDVDQKAVAAQTAVAAARKSLQDPNFVKQLGANRAEFERRLQLVEAALLEYERSIGVIRKGESPGAVAVMGMATTGAATLNPYLLVGGMIAASLMVSVGYSEIMRAGRSARRLDVESVGLRDFIASLPKPTMPPVDPNLVKALVNSLLQQAKVAAAAAATAEAAEAMWALQKLIGTTILAVAGTQAAVRLIHSHVMDMVGRFPPQPHCQTLLIEFEEHFRAALRNPRGHWKAFIEAAIALLRCIGRGMPPGGLTRGVLF